MATTKITELQAHTNPATTDVLPIVDVAADSTKKIEVQNLLAGAGSGTEAAPAIAFASDSDTGIYRPSADQIAVSTGGTNRVTVDSTGVTITEKIIHSNDENTFISFPANDTFAVTTAGTERIRILPTGGLTFKGDTQDANALDDYEEGTFNAATANNPQGWELISGNNDHSLTTDSNTGYYVKIGRLVYFTLRITNIDVATAGTGGGRLLGLPFASENTSGHLHGSVNVTLSTLFGSLFYTSGYIPSNSTTVYFMQKSTDTTQNFSQGSNKVLLVSGCYRSST